MISEELTDALQRLGKLIAPELTFTVVDGSLFDDLGIGEGCHGITITAGAMNLEGIVPDWAGEVVIGLYSDRLAECYGFGDDYSRALRAMFVHELAHALPARLPPSGTVFEAAEVKQLNTLRRRRKIKSSGLAAKLTHNERWLRRVCHLYVRAVGEGFDIDPYLVVGANGPLTQLPHFVCAMLGEVRELAGDNFAAIEAIEPPAAFTKMWEQSASFMTPQEDKQ